MNKARLIERIAELVNERRLDGIADLRDESDRDGMRVVIDLKRDAVAEVLLNQLYKHTPLQESFGINMLAVVDGRPQLLSLKDALEVFLRHRREVVVRRTVYDLRKAEERLHVLAGLKIAVENLDRAIAIIRAAADPHDGARGAHGRARLEPDPGPSRPRDASPAPDRARARQDHRGVPRDREAHRALSRDPGQRARGREDHRPTSSCALKEKYGDPRRTQIIDEAAVLSAEDLIVDEDMVVTISHEGYVKRNPAALYRAQRRGGRGKIGATTRDEDFVEHLFVASTHSYLMFFTNLGKVYWLKVHEIPQAGRAARGRAVTNLLQLKSEETLSAFLPVREFKDDHYLIFATRRGLVKKTDLMQYSSPRPSGLIAIVLEEGDEVVGVRLTDGQREVILSTADGQAIRFEEAEVRPMGRATYGVRGMTLDEGDQLVSVDLVEPGASLLAVAEKGYGKRTEMDEYRRTHRGGKGIITMKTTDKTGRVIGLRLVTDDDQIMLVSSGGKVVRIRVNEIRVIGRNTQGVRLIDLEEGERVAAVARLAEREDEVEVEAFGTRVGRRRARRPGRVQPRSTSNRHEVLRRDRRSWLSRPWPSSPCSAPEAGAPRSPSISARLGHTVRLWARNADAIASLCRDRVHPNHPSVALPLAVDADGRSRRGLQRCCSDRRARARRMPCAGWRERSRRTHGRRHWSCRPPRGSRPTRGSACPPCSSRCCHRRWPHEYRCCRGRASRARWHKACRPRSRPRRVTSAWQRSCNACSRARRSGSTPRRTPSGSR